MPNQAYAVTKQKLELRKNAVAANIEELPHLREPLIQAEVLLPKLVDLTSQQASLTASRQEVSKQLADVADQAQKLVTLMDVAVRQKYGTRSEKLVEFGQQPFRGKPRRRVEPDDQPLKSRSKTAEPPAEPPVPSNE